MNRTIWLAAIATVIFVLPGPARAQDGSPRSPTGVSMLPAGHVRIADREFWTYTAIEGGSWLTDTISTRQGFAWCDRHPERHCVEGGLLFPGSRSTVKIMGAWAAVDVGAALTSYEWKKHVTNRWLHPLWRVPLWFQSQAHVRAAAANWSFQR